MDLDTFKPTFLIQIEGQDLSKDITQEITSFVFTDNEEELDVLELSVTDRNLQFVDDPLFQEGNEIVAASATWETSPRARRRSSRTSITTFRKTVIRPSASRPTTRASNWRARKTRRSGRNPLPASSIRKSPNKSPPPTASRRWSRLPREPISASPRATSRTPSSSRSWRKRPATAMATA